MIWKDNNFLIKQLQMPALLLVGFASQIHSMEDVKVAATKVV